MDQVKKHNLSEAKTLKEAILEGQQAFLESPMIFSEADQIKFAISRFLWSQFQWKLDYETLMDFRREKGLQTSWPIKKVTQ